VKDTSQEGADGGLMLDSAFNIFGFGRIELPYCNDENGQIDRGGEPIPENRQSYCWGK
jgi:hypothetical protein